MLNYIKSEMYRTNRNRSLKVFIGICAALLFAMVLILFYYKSEPKFPYATSQFTMNFLISGMGALLLLTIVVAAIIDNNEYKNHTIKHTVSFGMNRLELYFSRFFAMLLNSVIVYVIIAAFFSLISFAFLHHEAFGKTMLDLLRVSLASFPCLMSGIAITYFFLMLFDNATVSIAWIVGVIVVLPNIMELLGMKFDIFNVMLKYTPSTCLSAGGKMVGSLATDMTATLTAVSVGFGWTIVFLVIGAICFQRQELK